jgi:type I restriction enzyme S subunit
VHYVDESLWLTDNAMYAHTFNYEFNLEFLSLLLSKLNLGKYARQTAQPVISFSSIKDIIISFPKDLREQKQIIKSVLDIENHTRSLTKLHEYRQDNYNALKSAILAQELQSEAA